MNCNPTPEVFCGTLWPDTCVPLTGTWPACFPNQGQSCYRQSEFNLAAGTLICSQGASITSILSGISLSALTGCIVGNVTITPVKTTVKAELQNIYDALCALQTDLNMPIANLDVACLEDPCGNPIGTLGQVLTALITRVCANANVLVYKANLTQGGTAAPTAVVAENSLDPSLANLTWAYVSTGIYTLTATGPLVGVFTNKSIILIGTGNGIGVQVAVTKTNTSTITVFTGSAGVAADGVLGDTSISIKIYP